jgi:hypothetical protein
MPEQRFDEDIARLLKTVAEHFNNEDKTTRERQVRNCRKLKLYWNNFSMTYWSETAHDYRIWGREAAALDGDQDYYDKPVNVFRAFLETIIAALSIQIPAIHCVPDDADNPNDLSTASAGDKIAELIYKHNNVIFIWLQALYIWSTEGLIAGYTYTKEDEKYGTYQIPKYKDEEVESYVCPNCGVRLPDDVMSDAILNAFQPDISDAELAEGIKAEGPVCTECGQLLDPNLQKTKLVVPKFIGMTTKPKSRVCLEVYGNLYVKIANYAKKQEDTPYLIHSCETHYSGPLSKYKRLRDEKKIAKGGGFPGDPYEQTARLNTQYAGDMPDENVTVTTAWLRPQAFEILEDNQYEKLMKEFPIGAKVVMVNEIVADYESEALDDAWTLTKNPLSDYLNHNPSGELLTNIQDILNDLISLTLQTIEHGIAQTFADPAVVDFNAQRQIEAMPGTLSPTKPTAGTRNIGESFFSVKQANLSPEVFTFYNILQELGQFVSGALPSIFGGQLGSGSSRTAQEYETSKNMALQRLQTPWKMLTVWWKEMFGKAIPAYMKEVKEDERYVKKDKLGNFVNTYIRKAELDGKIGDIELEPDDKMPVTDEQMADMVMQLMNLNNQQVMTALMDPENLPYLRKAIKMPQFKLPGEDDRMKQYEEISQLINESPNVRPPSPEEIQQAQTTMQELQPQYQSSVQIDPDIDNHGIEASICRTWLISPAGRLAKIENPEGYMNIMLHMKEHLQQIQNQMMGQALPAIPTQTTSAPAENTSGANNARPATV